MIFYVCVWRVKMGETMPLWIYFQNCQIANLILTPYCIKFLFITEALRETLFTIRLDFIFFFRPSCLHCQNVKLRARKVMQWLNACYIGKRPWGSLDFHTHRNTGWPGWFTCNFSFRRLRQGNDIREQASLVMSVNFRFDRDSEYKNHLGRFPASTSGFPM